MVCLNYHGHSAFTLGIIAIVAMIVIFEAKSTIAAAFTEDPDVQEVILDDSIPISDDTIRFCSLWCRF